jgi:glycosyltransferase involved in cell wall biosynthesis
VVVPLRLLSSKQKIRIVIAYDPFRSGLAALVLKYAFNCKMIVEVNGEYAGDFEHNEPAQAYASYFFKDLLWRLTLGSADAIKVLNLEQETHCRRVFPRTPVYRFPSFVATEYFESLSARQGNYLLSIGYPFHRKGVDLLIEAFKRIADLHPSIDLRIMGHCPEDELKRYQELAAGHPRISFIKPGWIEEVGEQLSGCYALVNAARSESMGRVHVEAMACGKPILAARTNGAMECVEDGKTGLLCELDNIADLAAKLHELLAEPVRALQMGIEGKLRMKKMFSEQVTIEKYRVMLEEIKESHLKRIVR